MNVLSSIRDHFLEPIVKLLRVQILKDSHVIQCSESSGFAAIANFDLRKLGTQMNALK